MDPNYSICISALFSDETPLFVSPSEPRPGDRVSVRFRVSRGDDLSVYLIRGKQEIKMVRREWDNLFDYYVAEFPMGLDRADYMFSIHYGEGEIGYYTKIGFLKEPNPTYCFSLVPGFTAPEWAKGAVMYQIFTDRFCNGDPTNDVESGEYAYINGQTVKVKDWEKVPDQFDVRCFYGGDLEGVRQKLDYIQSLGVSVIYFNPLFVSPSNHKYDIQDYDYIDPHFGRIVKDEGKLLNKGSMDNRLATRFRTRVTDKENLEASNAFFAELVEEIHRRGMRVILDGVFNHCGSFNRWLDRERIYEGQEGYEPGAYVSADSPYTRYFDFTNREAWPYNKSYTGWWGHDTLPKLNYEESDALLEDVLRIGEKWVSPPYNVDGWRLDVAADLGHSMSFNHNFWRLFRDRVKKANPQAVILAEHYGDPSSWLGGDQWDTVMNYDAFMDPVTWFLTGLEKHSDRFDGGLVGNGDWFVKNISHNMSKFLMPSLYTAMNELSNHDHSRFLTRTNHTVGRLASRGAEAAGRGIKYSIMKMAVVMQMTWPGAPTIYYGDEAGLVGWTDPDNRRTFPWGHENWELVEFHKYIIAMHNKISCLKTGSLKILIGGDHLLAYGRFDSHNQVIVVINNGDYDRNVSIPVWEAGVDSGYQVIKRLLVTTEVSYNVGRVLMNVEDGYLHIHVGPMSSQVFAAGKHDYTR